MKTSHFSIPSLDTHTPSDKPAQYLITTDSGQVLFSDDRHYFSIIPDDISEMTDNPIFIGSSPELNWFVAGLKNKQKIPEGYLLHPLRSLHDVISDKMLGIAGRAVQLVRFNHITRHCGVCGAENSMKDDELAKICPKCGNIIYPRLSPAIIVRITHGSHILMARAPQFPSGMYSIIAGFVEPGENLESAVRREVREEVGIEITDPVYFGSQPWPFPDSLMIGFTAEYLSGEIRVDGFEIIDAGWYPPESMPDLPGKLSISRILIDDFLNRSKSESKRP